MTAATAPELEISSFLFTVVNDTIGALAVTTAEEVKRRMPKAEWTGIGVEWMRSALGTREWRVPCLDVWIRL
jgi:hypothetical protein